MTNLKDMLEDFQQATIDLAQNDYTEDEEYELLVEDLLDTINKRLLGNDY